MVSHDVQSYYTSTRPRRSLCGTGERLWVATVAIICYMLEGLTVPLVLFGQRRQRRTDRRADVQAGRATSPTGRSASTLQAAQADGVFLAAAVGYGWGGQ